MLYVILISFKIVYIKSSLLLLLRYFLNFLFLNLILVPYK